MVHAAIRADPETRLPPRARHGAVLLEDARAAWAETALALTRNPILLGSAAVAWGLVRALCLRALERAHLDLAGLSLDRWQAAELIGLALLADTGPVLVAAVVIPPLHRRLLGGAALSRRKIALQGWRVFGLLLAVGVYAVLVLNLAIVLPAVLLPAMGPASTVLTLILLAAPLAVGAGGMLRLLCGLPALALGLPRAMAEGWAISRFRVLRSAAVWIIALAPAVAVAAAWISLGPDPLGWAATLLHPILDVLLAALTASVTGLFYRANRLPAALRPDVAPSNNRPLRKDPVLQ